MGTAQLLSPCFLSLDWLGGSALEERAIELGSEPFLSVLLESVFPGVEEASGASLSARSLELMVSAQRGGRVRGLLQRGLSKLTEF